MIHMLKADHDELLAARAERDRLLLLLNTPELVDFDKAVPIEAAHQTERHGVEHDAGKEPTDWFWLLSHLAGRAFTHRAEAERLSIELAVNPTPEQTAFLQPLIEYHHGKALHHSITTAAALRNWHAQTLGLSNLRPGIAPPMEYPA